MEILGVILWFIMPALAGYTVCNILRWKETNQIETYLIGFFFLFFSQSFLLIFVHSDGVKKLYKMHGAVLSP